MKPSPISRDVQTSSVTAKWICVLFIINTITFSLLSLRFWSIATTPSHLGALVFMITATIGHCSLLAFGCLLLPLLLIACRIKAIIIKPLAIFLSASLFSIILIDSFCYQQYRFHINYAVLELAFGPASREIFAFPTSMYIKIVAVIGSIFLLYCGLGFGANYLSKNSSLKSVTRCCCIGIVALIISCVTYSVADVVSYTPVTQSADVLPYFPRITARKAFAKLGIKASSPRFNIEPSEGNLLYPIEPIKCISKAPALNILFLVIDAWRFDMLKIEETPHVFDLASQSLNFTNHTSGGSATRSGIFSLFYALPTRYWHPVLAERQAPIFMTKLQELNYQFGIFASAPLSSPEFDRTVFTNINLPSANKGKTVADRDIEIKDRFIEFINQRNKTQPFFGFVFFDAPHAFILPKEFPKKFLPSLEEPDFMGLNPKYDPEPFFNLYRNTLTFNDQLIGEIIAALRDNDSFENTIIVVTGDHGQEFNEHQQNYWGHNGNFSKLQANVPLIIRWPGRQPETFNHWTSHVDVVPTLLEQIFGCSNDPAGYSVGKSLFNKSERTFLLLGNYGKTAIVEPNRITTMDPYGPLLVTDGNLKPLQNNFPSIELFQSALEQQSRFFANQVDRR